MKNAIITILVISLITTMTLQTLVSGNPTEQKVKETTYERVLRTGVIRCAYMSWKPYSLKDPNRPDLPPVGSSVDIMTEAAKRLGLRVEYSEEIGWGAIGEGFASNRYDAVCTQMWPDAPKIKNLSLSDPLFFSEIAPYVRSGDNRFKNLSDINQSNVRIAVIDGALTQNLAIEKFPNAKLVGLPQTASSAEYYMTVTTGKADVLLGDADEVTSQKSVANIPLEPIKGIESLRVLPHVFAFPRDDQRLTMMINKALQQIKNEGFLDNIAAKYKLQSKAPKHDY